MRLRWEDFRFLDAIKESPHDDTPRLVFSDLLQSRQSPWGELIAVQCDLARRAKSAPTANANANAPKDAAAHAKLVAREYALTRSYETWWPKELGNFEILAFKRGFPSDVAFASATDVTQAARWFQQTPELDLVRVDLRESSVLHLITMDYFPSRGLMLRPQVKPEPGYEFDVLDADMLLHWLAQVAQLETLKVSGEIQYVAAQRLFESPILSGLHHVGIADTSGRLYGMADWLCRPTELTFEGIRSPWGFAIRAGSTLNQLERLTIDNTNCRTDDLLSLVNNSKSGVKAVSAEGTSLNPYVAAGTDPLPNLLRSEALRNLEVFDVSRTRMPHDWLCALADAFRSLTTFRLGNLDLDDALAADVIRRAERLNRIGLRGNPVSHTILETIAARGVPVEELGMSNTTMGDAGIEIIASSPETFSTLESLEVFGVGMTEAGARLLASCEHLSPALRLVVSAREVGEQSALLRDRFAIVVAI